jgi:anthranilate/para-aminobenzoate synthase component I
MPLCAIVVDVAPDPVAIAQRFEGRPGFAFLHGGSDGESGRRSIVAVDPVQRSTAWLPPADETLAPAADLDSRGDVPRWIGVIPYESARDLERGAWTRTPDERPVPHLVQPSWQRYGAVVDVDVARGVVRVVGDDEERVVKVARELRAAPHGGRAPVRLFPLEEDDPPAAHLERVRRAKELIGAGDLYQVNLARRQRFAAEGSPLDLYLAMAEHAPAAFGACLDLGETVVCASSPELFWALDPGTGRMRTAPIKGTRPRGSDADSDAALRRALDQSAKECAELTMILDVERNDLGKVSTPGSVRLLAPPRVETHRTIHHRGAVLGGTLRSGTTPLSALRAMFPSGSVTGAPKVRAMEVIARLEPARRGLYTGAYGYVAWSGAIRLAMAIRVMTWRDGEAHYFAGGGIVADSDPEAELEETRWKATQVERLVRRAPAGSRRGSVAGRRR